MADEAPKAPKLNPVVPIHARRNSFIPQAAVDPKRPEPHNFLNVTLPGEVVRCIVIERFSDDVFLCVIQGVVLGKTGHTYKSGDKVAVQRSQQNDLSEIWVPISDREVQEREERERAVRAADAAKPPVALANEPDGG